MTRWASRFKQRRVCRAPAKTHRKSLTRLASNDSRTPAPQGDGVVRCGLAGSLESGRRMMCMASLKSASAENASR